MFITNEMKDKKKYVISYNFEVLLNYHADQNILDQACSCHNYNPDELDYDGKKELLGEKAYEDANNSLYLYANDIDELIVEKLYDLYPDHYTNDLESSVSLSTSCENFQETSGDSWSLSTPCKISGKMIVFLKKFNQDEFENELKELLSGYVNDALHHEFTDTSDELLSVEAKEVPNIENEVIKNLSSIDYKKRFSPLIKDKLSDKPYFEVATEAFDFIFMGLNLKNLNMLYGRIVLDKAFVEKCLERMTNVDDSESLQDDLDLFILHPDKNGRHYNILKNDFVGIIHNEIRSQHERLNVNFEQTVTEAQKQLTVKKTSNHR